MLQMCMGPGNSAQVSDLCWLLVVGAGWHQIWNDEQQQRPGVAPHLAAELAAGAAAAAATAGAQHQEWEGVWNGAGPQGLIPHHRWVELTP
jgi:hypothetical protein